MRTIMIQIPEEAYLTLMTYLKRFLEDSDQIDFGTDPLDPSMLKYLLTIPGGLDDNGLDFKDRKDITITVS